MEGSTSALSFITQLLSRMFAIRGRSATQARKRSTLPSTQKENSQKDSSTSTNNVENSIIFCDNIQPGALATSELKEDIPMHNEDRGQQRCANQGKGLPTNLVQVGATHKEGVSFLNGAKDITITGNPSFNGYYHQYHHHHHHHHYYYPPSSLRYNPISGVTFVDLTGKEYSVSADHAVSRELFCKTIRLFFHGNIFEAYFQREEMEWGSYELIVVHQGTEIIKLDDKVWQSSFEVGMKVVMFPTFTAYQRYQCPHCHTWLVIDPELTAVVCQWCNFNFEPAQDDTRWLFPCDSRQRVAKNQVCRAFEGEMKLAAIAGKPAFSRHLDGPKDRYVKWLLSV